MRFSPGFAVRIDTGKGGDSCENTMVAERGVCKYGHSHRQRRNDFRKDFAVSEVGDVSVVWQKRSPSPIIDAEKLFQSRISIAFV